MERRTRERGKLSSINRPGVEVEEHDDEEEARRVAFQSRNVFEE